jgi:hypothetical protein
MSNGQIGMASGSTCDWAANFRAVRTTELSVEWKD